MKLFDVYPLFDITPVKGEGCYIWDNEGNKYLDLYGGHAVISVGHSHPHYVQRLTDQIKKIGFYSNSVQNPMQSELATKLGQMAGLDDFELFLCNSGAEAVENALKLASFHTKRSRIISFEKGFHGRTSGAVAITDNPKIVAPFNANHESTILPINNIDLVEKELASNDVAAVIIEGIQGIGGIVVPDPSFLEGLKTICEKHGTILILDEVQSGYGRSGEFFAFQHTKVEPDIITMAKGMGNGFPVGGLLISPKFEASYGLLGTTFGGNYLACAASLAVLEIIESENLITNAKTLGNYIMENLQNQQGIKELRGQGLMIGMEYNEKIVDLRKQLLFEHRIFTGVSGTNTVRLLPPLNLSKKQADYFLSCLHLTANGS